MTAFAKSRPAGDLLDPRLIDEQNLLPLEISPDAIRVFGALTMKDLRASDLKRNIQTAKRRLFLWMLTFNSVAAVVLYFLYFNDAGRLPQFMIAGAVIWFNLRILNRMRYALGTKYDEDQILLKLHGGIAADGIQLASTVGTTQYAWSAFVSVAQEADIVSLRLQGTQGHNVVLTRRMFSSDEDWQRAMKTFENIDGRIQNNVG